MCVKIIVAKNIISFGETIDLRNSDDKVTYPMKIILRNLMSKNKVVHLRPWPYSVCSGQVD